MVNKLMRRRLAENKEQALVGEARVRSKAATTEAVGSVTLEPGESAWIGWMAAKGLESRGKVEILEYEQSLVEQARRSVGEDWQGDPGSLPGLLCQECLAVGKISIFANQWQMNGHTGSHRPGHGKHLSPPKPKPPVGRAKKPRKSQPAKAEVAAAKPLKPKKRQATPKRVPPTAKEAVRFYCIRNPATGKKNPRPELGDEGGKHLG